MNPLHERHVHLNQFMLTAEAAKRLPHQPVVVGEVQAVREQAGFHVGAKGLVEKYAGFEKRLLGQADRMAVTDIPVRKIPRCPR